MGTRKLTLFFFMELSLITLQGRRVAIPVTYWD